MEQKILQWIVVCSLCLSISFLTACSKDDDEPSISNSSNSSSSVAAPSLRGDYTVTTTDQVDFKFTFNNGGDTFSNMSCTVYWKAYASKPSSAPTKSQLTNIDYMQPIQYAKTATEFRTSHAGFTGGTYIYYYAKCRNSKHSVDTSVSYHIIKR